MATELHRTEVRLFAPTDLVGLVPAQVRARTTTAVSTFDSVLRSAGRSDIFIRGRSSTGVYVETTDDGDSFLRSLPGVASVLTPA